MIPRCLAPDQGIDLPTSDRGREAVWISVVVPVYNSEKTLAPLIKRLAPVLERVAGGRGYEVILVNDGSRDGSWSVVREMAARHPWIVGIDLMRNFGQHNALLAGIRAARGEITGTLDDDLQHPPEELPLLLDRLNEDTDVVYGTAQEQRHGLLRNAASRFTKLALQAAMGAETADKVSAFRVFRTGLRDGFAQYIGKYVSVDVLLTWSTTRFDAVAVRHDARTEGKSNYTLGKLCLHAMNMLTGFSTLPLQLASFLGFSLTAFGACILVFVLGRYAIQGTSVPGFTFLASLVGILGGAQLFALGIIGEYLARMHFRVMRQPAYAVRSLVGVSTGSIAQETQVRFR